jgi:NAD(P)-dependent dehydrogenase (short-subunit alcohol dehydrogenase family)
VENQHFKPDGKVNFITVCGSGLGRTIADGLAEEGADLVTSDVEGETCND